MKTGRYSLKELLTHNEIDQIIIPEIQRDYVWQNDNVAKLIDDILQKFEKKEKHSLQISVNGKLEDNISVNNFLTREYERLKYKQKLGFIYAYHDKDFAGKFFLIDGQQRLTTLFLILIYLYKSLSDNRSHEFFQFYYPENKLKLDYKVREESHDFLKLFVKSEIEKSNYKDSVFFYQDYLKDITISNIISNYEKISEILSNYNQKDNLLEFLEDFVEVNYFDTHLSDQGEQLYIYMNSRGEQLSHQEILRAELMKKTDDSLKKIEMGNLWEDWQNFFWQNRGNNENADIGFEEFLKWATILHILLNSSIELTNFLADEKSYSQKELKENYIKEFRHKKDISSQKEAVLHYQIHYLHFDFLTSVYNSLQWLYNQESDFIPTNKGWLSADISKLHYAYLLPLIQYIRQFSSGKIDEEIEIENVERVAMFLKNLSFFEHVTKNPDTTTIELVELVSKLNDDQYDLLNLYSTADIHASESLLTKNEKSKLNLFNSQKENRRIWEEFFWNLTLKEDFSQFTMGDSTVFFNCITQINTEADVSTQIEELWSFFNILNEVFYKNHTKNITRLFILCKYDYLIEKGKGNNIQKYSFIPSDLSYEARREWKELFVNPIFCELLNWIKDKKTEDIDELFAFAKEEFLFKDYREAFIKTPEILKYCHHNKILWENETRIQILNQTNYSVSNSREIQVALLKEYFRDKKVWIHENNCCVFDFDYNIENEEIVSVENLKGKYALDFVYKHNHGRWSFTLFSRDYNITDNFENLLLHDWRIEDNRLTLQNFTIPAFDYNKSLLENNIITAKSVEDILQYTNQYLKIANHD